MKGFFSNIDQKKTKKAVEEIIYQYRTHILAVEEEKMPLITTNYTLEMPNFNKLPHSAVEIAALKNVETQLAAERFFEWFSRGMKKLLPLERELIVLSYLEMQSMYVYEIANRFNVSERKFYRMRDEAIYKLAIALGVVVYKKE